MLIYAKIIIFSALFAWNVAWVNTTKAKMTIPNSSCQLLLWSIIRSTMGSSQIINILLARKIVCISFDPKPHWNEDEKNIYFSTDITTLYGHCDKVFRVKLQLLLLVVTVFVVDMMFQLFKWIVSFQTKPAWVGKNSSHVFIEQIIVKLGHYMTVSKVLNMEMYKWVERDIELWF